MVPRLPDIGIGDIGDFFGYRVRGVTNLSVRSFAAAYETLAAVGEAALHRLIGLLGINYEDLKAAIKQCKHVELRLPEFSKVDLNLPRVAGNLVEAAERAVGEVSKNWDNYLPAALEDWLRLPTGLVNAAQGGNPQDIFVYLLGALGLRWDNLLTLIQTQLGADSIVLLDLFDRLSESKYLDQPDEPQQLALVLNHMRVASDWLGTVPGFEKALKDSVVAAGQALLQQIREVTSAQLKDQFLAILGNQVGKALLGGWVGTILHLVKFAGNELGGICGLVGEVATALTAAIEGAGVEELQERFVAGIQKALPLAVKFAASKVTALATAPDVVRNAVDAAKKKADGAIWAPLTTVIGYLGRHASGLVDRFLGPLAFVSGVSRPLAKPALQDSPQVGPVRLWVAKSGLKPKLMASPETDVLDYLYGFSKKNNPCLQQVKGDQYVKLNRAAMELADLLRKKGATRQDVSDVGKANAAVISAENKLIEAILGCGSAEDHMRLDPCDLAGLMMNTKEDTSNDKSLSTRYARRGVQVEDHYGDMITYSVVQSMVALIGYHTPDEVKRSGTVAPDANRLFTQKCRQRKGPGVSESQFNCTPAVPGCTNMYLRRVTVGYPGRLTGPLPADPQAPVTGAFCLPPGNEQESMSGCPKLGSPSGNDDAPGKAGNPACRDQVGHILARKFGGLGTRASGNIFPQYPKANQRLGDAFEQHAIVNKYLLDPAKSKRVCIRFSFIFGSGEYPHRPTRTSYDWWVDRVQQPPPAEEFLLNPETY